MFLSELLEVLEVCELTKLEPLISKLFKRLIKCISGSHLQVNLLHRLQIEPCAFLKMTSS